MYYYVNGTVAEIDAGLAVIDCSGVGYACATTNYTLSQLKKGAPAKLYTYLNVREDAMELFGFADQSELRSFKLLIGVFFGKNSSLLIIQPADTAGNVPQRWLFGRIDKPAASRRNVASSM